MQLTGDGINLVGLHSGRFNILISITLLMLWQLLYVLTVAKNYFLPALFARRQCTRIGLYEEMASVSWQLQPSVRAVVYTYVVSDVKQVAAAMIWLV